MPNIPIRREEITNEWLALTLSGSGACEISDCDFEEMTGHNPELSQLFRVRIQYRKRGETHPDVVIVKIPPENDETRLREAGYGPYEGELGAYRLLEPFYGSNIARMYGAVEDLNERTACFVFEDIGTLPAGDKYARIDLGLAKETLSFMATYHARFWNHSTLETKLWIRDADWSFLFNQDPLESAIGWRVIRDDDRFEKTGGLVVAGEYLGARLLDLQVAMRSRPNTLTHNDFHHGNVLLRNTASGSVPVIVDWQMSAFAGGTNDLAKFLMTTVPFKVLVENETRLVHHYVDELKAHGVSGYEFDECWRDYRRAQVATFGNYAISCYKTSPDGGLIESSGDSTHAVIRALTLADPDEMAEVLP